MIFSFHGICKGEPVMANLLKFPGNSGVSIYLEACPIENSLYYTVSSGSRQVAIVR
ncbi:MAG: hypothetical protein KAH31_06370 [Candidatus Sabulitectum sp.]|nr:hypothetical protein [Candidatus Sabulitectum sp.]